MKHILILCLSLFASLSFAQTDIGKEIKPELINGSPSIGIQIVHDRDYGFMLTTSLSGKKLTSGKPLKTLYYRYFDAHTDEFISDWEEFYTSSSGSTYYPGMFPFQLSESGQEKVSKLMGSLKSLKIVLLLNSDSKNLLHISVEEICKSHPNKVMDLSTMATGCDL